MYYLCRLNFRVVMRKNVQTYVINFAGLSNGLHHFDFEITDTFFANFEYSEIQEGCLKVHLSLNKSDRLLNLHFAISGVVSLACDRCLQEMDYPIEIEDDVVVRFGSEEGETEDGFWVISNKAYQLDLSDYLYETIAVQRPIQWAHPVDENGQTACDPEMMARLEQMKSLVTEDENFEIAEDIEDEDQEPDDTWRILEKLKHKL